MNILYFVYVSSGCTDDHQEEVSLHFSPLFLHFYVVARPETLWMTYWKTGVVVQTERRTVVILALGHIEVNVHRFHIFFSSFVRDLLCFFVFLF